MPGVSSRASMALRQLLLCADNFFYETANQDARSIVSSVSTIYNELANHRRERLRELAAEKDKITKNIRLTYEDDDVELARIESEIASLRFTQRVMRCYKMKILRFMLHTHLCLAQ